MDKPSYNELEIQVLNLKKQIDFAILNSDVQKGVNETRIAELKVANEKLKFEEKEKSGLVMELFVLNQKVKQLLQLNADKNRFIAILAHDLRSPFWECN